MPNHVTNRLIIIGASDEVAKCLAQIQTKYKNDDGVETDDIMFIDFNKINPIPVELQGTVSPMRTISQKDYDAQEARIAKGELSPIEKSFGISRSLTVELATEYLIQFGANNWYDWQNANWGTKWNGYSQSMDGDVIVFDTAWSTPEPIIAKLSSMFPDLRFEVEYADEDLGHNVGKYVYVDGNCEDETTIEGGSLEAYRMALRIKGADYYLYDYLVEAEELDKFTRTLVQLAHEQGKLFDNYPTFILEALKVLAVRDEQFERVALIDKMILAKETQQPEIAE